MATRVLIAGVASFLVFGAFVVMVWMSLPPGQTLTATPSTVLARTINDGSQRLPNNGDKWTVTTATSAHNALVVEVQAQHLEDTLDIAHEIVTPVLSKGYEEILIYVHPPGGYSDGPMRRVQWTPARGYVESVFAPLQ